MMDNPGAGFDPMCTLFRRPEVARWAAWAAICFLEEIPLASLRQAT
jgi:hypothetical protein